MWDMVDPINRHNVLIINDDICPMDSRDIYHFFDTNSIAELYDIEFYKHPECEYNVDEDKYYPTGYAIIYIDYWYDTNNSSSFYNSLIYNNNNNNKDKDSVFVFRTSGNGPPWKIELYYNGYFNCNVDKDTPHKIQKTHSQTSTSTQTDNNYNDLSKKRKREENNYLDQHNHEQHNDKHNHHYQFSDQEENDYLNEHDHSQFSYDEEEEEERSEKNDENVDLCFDIINFINLKNNYRTIHKKYYNLTAVNQCLVKRNKELVKSLKKNKTLNKKNTWCRRLRNLF